ncbi:ATP--guanido phosphotransferase [Halobacillus halophilus]|uniref:Protein-arginine kinase n=1 Tax=Halobacillus halophilus (strain ATCC 35676 / DSM 2266 / JCM 20832 / KCTC 3685 / LMG 17431 / NBRC 102448 / NCIMB 2269) TaxID=866895 RepID=I0JH64_HALH3|nr:protein arginine kinase [Halobacillus halophilus]ASF37705.1 ATP--guanido phosphotransferase [Halobacillus halophilus]CCG43482.1 putative ATP:guanido phosphotransferase [Halobacillus halophilus DSM 2266]
MSLQQFMNEALSPWMKQDGPDSDIVLSSRIRLARNFSSSPFPLIASDETLEKVLDFFKEEYKGQSFRDYKGFEVVQMNDLEPVEKRVLVEKHLISPHLAEKPKHSAALISENEQVSIMINEEDHIRLQLYFPGFQLDRALEQASQLDDWLEEKINYAFDEKRGYLTACPTNVGTGMRASVMMHLPALSMTQQINRMTPAINQLGLVVRGIYGEGSEALGSIYQISNQITLGKSEQDIVEDLHSVVKQLIDQERRAREALISRSGVQLEDRIFRSYGVLKHSRIIESKEAAKCLSDLRLGIDLKLIDDIPRTILNELMILTQPGFLQQYAKASLNPDERDVRRASLIRERLQLENEE